jgi:hypothetical protein
MVYLKEVHKTGASAQLLAQTLEMLIAAAQWELDTKFKSSNPGAILQKAIEHSKERLERMCEPIDPGPVAG